MRTNLLLSLEQFQNSYCNLLIRLVPDESISIFIGLSVKLTCIISNKALIEMASTEVASAKANSAQEFSTDLLRVYYGIYS